ncbi:MAG: TonB family protein [Blastocatellia bacterium]
MMHNPPLEKIKIAAPCNAEWRWMYGNDRVRFCGQCSRNVYNLSAMTRQQAEDLILRTEGRLCVRFYRRADGTILTRNCAVGLQAVKDKFTRTRTHIIAAILTLLGYLGIMLWFHRPAKALIGGMGQIVLSNPTIEPRPEMGKMAPPIVAPLVEKSEQFIRDKAIFKVTPVFHSAGKGEVIVRVMISLSGQVVDTRLIEGDSTLKEIAEEAALRWKFEPMLVDGKPARVDSRLTFRLNQ